MKLSQILEKADHLLAGLEYEDELKEEIDSLRRETKGLIHLVEVGHEVAAQLGLSLLSPKIDDLITKIGQRKTLPPI